MVKYSFSSEIDQHDSKVFKETLGTFGTTTVPGGEQLTQLQAKVRQGVKHVELHVLSRGKGGGPQDVPDKYGFEQRRTIMQLAKLNQQTLSVHSALDVVSLSGLEQSGFSEASRWEAIKEIDETINFAAQTAKGGAVTMHLQGEGLNMGSRADLTLSKRYLDWLEKNNKQKELDELKKNYFTENPLDRMFVDNPEKLDDLRFDYDKLSFEKKRSFEQKYAKKIAEGAKPYELYFLESQKDRRKLGANLQPYVLVGGQLQQLDRQQEFVDLDFFLDDSKLSDKDRSYLSSMGIHQGKKFSFDDLQKAMSIFTNGRPSEFVDKITEEEFDNLKSKVMVNYEKVVAQNNFLQNQADSDFFKKFSNFNVKALELQKKRLNVKYTMFKDELARIKQLEEETRDALVKIEEFDESEKGVAAKDALKMHIAMKNQELQQLKYYSIGQEDYHELAQYDKAMAEINKNLKELKEKSGSANSLADESFERNVSGLGYLGLKALRYQMDLKILGEEAKEKLPKLKSELESLEDKYYKSSSYDEKNNLSEQIAKKKRELRYWTGRVDYIDPKDGVDLENRPLYIAPENMLPGMGNLTSIEEFKAVVRMGQQDFADKIISDSDDAFKKIREDYEKLTGKKITKDNAMELAKKHVAGAFDTAHAGAWLKHFRKKEGESEEGKIERFNEWMKDEIKSMVKEGLVKHVHFNDTSGKDDDHNLMGAGVLDMHGLRRTFRDAGIREALIVEAGGRGASRNLHLLSTFELFNVGLHKESDVTSYRMQEEGASGRSISDWTSVNRSYNRRPQYSSYGMGESTFRHLPPQQGQERGEWSGTGFF